ncbi:hypothetical protein L218DRAFT_947420 [Marasmius fiardii PR-910]|nr:hypothetical protein L218DRAFT_947420 [Marasmius fiardii PR-910]
MPPRIIGMKNASMYPGMSPYVIPPSQPQASALSLQQVQNLKSVFAAAATPQPGTQLYIHHVVQAAKANGQLPNGMKMSSPNSRQQMHWSPSSDNGPTVMNGSPQMQRPGSVVNGIPVVNGVSSISPPRTPSGVGHPGNVGINGQQHPHQMSMSPPPIRSPQQHQSPPPRVPQTPVMSANMQGVISKNQIPLYLRDYVYYKRLSQAQIVLLPPSLKQFCSRPSRARSSHSDAGGGVPFPVEDASILNHLPLTTHKGQSATNTRFQATVRLPKRCGRPEAKASTIVLSPCELNTFQMHRTTLEWNIEVIDHDVLSGSLNMYLLVEFIYTSTVFKPHIAVDPSTLCTEERLPAVTFWPSKYDTVF